MPVLNYHKIVKNMPDMNKPQKCDSCGAEQIGNLMYYSHPKKNEIEVICRSCFLIHPSRPTRLAPDRAKRAEKSKPSASKRSKSGAAGKA